MPIKRLWLLVASFSLMLLCMAFAWALPPQQTVNALPPAEASGSGSVESTPVGDAGFVIRSFDGKVAVFQAGAAYPETVYDVAVESLPPIDQARLHEGIEVQTRGELSETIEDYIS